MKTKLIYICILIIIVFSAILMHKINETPEYVVGTYEQVYNEYEQIINMETNNQAAQDVISSNSQIILNNSSTNNYRTIGVIQIPKIDISYPIINDCTEENLNIAPVKYFGPPINTVGNLVVVGHNNWNKDFFSNLHKLEKNDIVELTDTRGNKLTYKVYDIYEIKENDFSCLEQNTDGKIELTLLTCIKYQKNKRLVVKCVAI